MKDRGVLKESAIIIEAGEGREDRLLNGSYLELRSRELAVKQGAAPRLEAPTPPALGETMSTPGNVKEPEIQSIETENPFGL